MSTTNPAIEKARAESLRLVATGIRTQALRAGEPLSAVTARLVAQAGLATRLVPATDDPVRTFVVTPAGTFSFQEWFVARGHADEVDAVEYRGAHGRGRGARRDRRDRACRPPGARAEQSVRLDRSDSRRRADSRRCRRSPCSLHRRQPAHRWARGQGTTRPYAHADGRRYDARAPGRAVRRDDRRARDRPHGSSGAASVPLVVTDTLMSDTDAARRLAESVLEAGS